MAIDKLIPQYLNKDDDERLIKSMEMTDALNVRVSVESEGSSSVIKNVLGNTIVVPKEETDAIPTQGYNRVIGCVSTESGDSIYYFLYNSVGFHGIYKYNYWEDNYIKLYESSHLNFARTSFIKADLIINQYGEHLLYFTDGINEPRKINATRLQLGEYDPTINTGTNEQKELFFTVAKRPPMYPPVFEFQTNTTFRANHLKENVFQFAYQYVYDDGEISALSPYSGLAVSSTNLAYNSLSRSTFSSENNELKVTVMNSDGPVKKIRVFARRNNDGAFFKVVELDNIIADNDPNSVQSFLFKNDGTYVFLSEEEINKLFDAVPRTAKAEAFSNNRLFYGNYKEGFDNIETNTYAYPVYYSSDESITADIEVYSGLIPSYAEFFYNIPPTIQTIISNNWNKFVSNPIESEWFYLFNKRRQLGSLKNYFGKLLGPRDDNNIWEQFQSGGNDSYNVAVYGVGDGMSFIIDTSEYPENGVLSDFLVSVNIVISCSQIGIGTTSSSPTINSPQALGMRFPIQVTRKINGQTHHAETLYVCTPSAPYDSPYSDQMRLEEAWDMMGNINGGGLNLRSMQLFPASDIVFNLVVPVSANTTRAELNQIISSNLIQQGDAFCSVSGQLNPQEQPGTYNYIKTNGGATTHMIYSHEIDDYKQSTDEYGNVVEHGSTLTDSNYGISCVASPLTPNYPFVNDQQNLTYNNVFLYFSGSLNFGIESAEEINDGTAIKCKVIRTGANLTVDSAVITRGQRVYLQDNYDIDGFYLHTTPYFRSGFDGPFYLTKNQFKTDSEAGYVKYLSGLDIQGFITTETTNDFGFEFSDRIDGQNSLRTAYVNPVIQNSSISLIQSDSELISSSFKTGGIHDIAAVYFDHRMRACGVQRLSNQVSVSHFGMFDRYNNNGRTEIDLRLMHTPPYWAKYWAPVYSKNLTYEKFLQVTVAEAFIGNKTTYTDILSPTSGDRPIIQSLDQSDKGTIFLSLRGLEGKNESYKEFKGAELKYSFTPGDKIRIMEYKTETGYTVAPHHEFVVTGYHYFQDDDKNPIKVVQTSSNPDENNYRRTGWFLAIRDEDISGFNQEAVVAGTDLFSQKCLIEIFSPKKNTDKVPYFEVGSVYPIVDTPFGRTHGGDRDNISIPDFLITITSQYSFTSSQRLYIGDKVLVSGQNADGYVFVNGILPMGGGFYNYSINQTPSQAFSSFNETVLANIQDSTSAGLFAGVITLNKGDVYLRLREQLVNPESNDYIQAGQTFKFNKTKPDLQEYDTFLIESDTVSDFFDSKATSIGRPHIETPDQREIIRSSSVTYSDPYAFDSAVLSLSSFNPSLFPYKDYNSKHGAITYLHDGGEVLYVLQQYKVAQQPISREYIEHSSGGMLVTSQNVMGTENYFAGNFGPGNNPEGVVQAMGRIYFPSKTTGKVVQIGGNGIELISDKSMDSFFMENLSALDADIKMPCGFDPDNDEFIISWSDYFIEEPLIQEEGDVEVEEESGTGIDKPTDFEPVGTEPVIVISLPVIEEMTEDRGSIRFQDDVIDEAEITFDDSGDAVIYVERVNAEGGVYVSKDKIATGKNIRAAIKNDKGDVIGYGTIALASGQLFISKDIADQYDIEQRKQTSSTPTIYVPPIVIGDPQVPEPEIYTPTIPADLIVVAYTGKTVAYDVSAGLWKTLYSFVPELYANVHNRMFTFYNGNIYRHNNNELRNNFYGQQYNSEIEIVSKQNPSMIKTYTALSIEGNSMWPAIISNSTQDTNIPSYKFINREGMYYSDILRNTNNTSTSNLVVLGVVASVSGQEITFANRISDATFNVGSLIVKDTGDAGGITSGQITSRNSMLVTGDVSSVAAGDILLVSSDPYISGDRIRDYYIKIRLINGIPTARELYAVNAVFETSQLHNQQVN